MKKHLIELGKRIFFRKNVFNLEHTRLGSQEILGQKKLLTICFKIKQYFYSIADKRKTQEHLNPTSAELSSSRISIQIYL